MQAWRESNIRSAPINCTKPIRSRSPWVSFLLLVRSDVLGTCEQLLEIRTVPDWIPDRVDLQTSYGSYRSCRDGEQTSKSLNGFLRFASTRFDLREPHLEIWTS